MNTQDAASTPSAATDQSVAVPRPRLSRRRFLAWAGAGGAGAAGLLAVACGPSLSQLAPTPAPTAAPAAAPAAAPTTAAPTTSQAQTPAATTGAAAGATPAAAAPQATTASAAKPKPSGQVIVGLSQEPTVFNPLMAHIEVDEGVHHNLFDPLWGVDDKGAYFPVLATEVPSLQNGGVSQDGLTWRVKLRDGVKWHDGQPFTADDVKFTHDLIMRDDFKAGSRQGHELVTEMQVVSPTEITWKMKQAYAPYFAILASTFIVPKHILGSAADPNTADFNNAPVGTGAFVWGERVPGDHITLTANPNYFGDGPYLEKVVFKYISDLTVMFTQFKTGEIDYTGLQGITPDHFAEAKTLADRDIHLGEQAFIEAISCNLGNPVFQEKEVRQALYLGMDKDTIIKNIYNGVHKTSESYLPTSSWAYNPNLPAHEYNPQKAMQVLDAAGWKAGADGIREKNGLKLQFTNSTTAGNKVREQTQAFLQQGWQQIGVGMEIKDMPAAVVWGDYTNMSQYETIMSGTHFGIGPDPDATFYFASTMSPVKGGHGDNHMQYSNPQVDELLSQGATTIDQDKRKAIYQQLQQVLRDDLAILPMFQYGFIEGTKKGLTGYVNNPNVVSNAWNIRTWRWQA